MADGDVRVTYEADRVRPVNVRHNEQRSAMAIGLLRRDRLRRGDAVKIDQAGRIAREVLDRQIRAVHIEYRAETMIDNSWAMRAVWARH
jgi:protein-tyrosine-phosphatase